MTELDNSSHVLSVRIRATPHGLSQVVLETWPDEQEFSCSGVYRVRIFFQGQDELLFHGMLQKDLRAYFSGQPVSFLNYPVDLQNMTPFGQKVLDLARSIPWGETQSYGWLSAQLKLKGGARAVGGALGKNPLPIIIPCHRILRKDGQLGGFSAGIQWKRFLLDRERNASLKTLIEFVE